MSWRTVVITQRAKLDMKNGYLVMRTENEQKRVHLDEISVLMIENSAVSITGCLLAELMEHKIKTIFCDEKRNPCGELIPYYGSHDCSGKLRKQIRWSEDVKAAVWTEIVTEKIRQQAELLKELGKNDEADMLFRYREELEYNDTSNREGHAAKVYFNDMLACREYLGKRLFITVNLRSYLGAQETSALFRSAILQKLSLFCIENREYPRLSQEQRIIVDEDACVI